MSSLSAPSPASGKIRSPTPGEAMTDHPRDTVAPSLANRFRRGSQAVVLTRVGGILITAILTWLLPKALDETTYGVLVALQSLIAFAGAVALCGLNWAVVRFLSAKLGVNDVDGARDVLRKTALVAAVSIVVVGTISAAALWFAGGYLRHGQLFDLAPRTLLVPLAALALVLLATINLLAETLRGFHKLGMAGLFSGGQSGGLLANVMWATLIAALWISHASTLSDVTLSRVMLAWIASLAVAIPVALVFLYRTASQRLATSLSENRLGEGVSPLLLPRQPQKGTDPGGPQTGSKPQAADVIDRLSYAALLATCLPLTIIQALSFASQQADVWIASWTLSDHDVAIYALARRFMLLVTMPFQLVTFTIVSSISELHAQGRIKQLEAVLRRASLISTAISFVAVAGLWLVGRPLIAWLVRPELADAAVPLVILACGQLMLSLTGLSHFTLIMTGRQNVLLLVNLIACLLLFTLGQWAAQVGGVTGLAWAAAAIVSLETLVLCILVKRYVGVWTFPTIGFTSADLDVGERDGE